MKENNVKKNDWIRYGIGAFICIVLSLLVAWRQGFSLDADWHWNARCLSDGFFVIGLAAAGFGGLMAIAATDFFDVFRYGFHSLLVLFSSLKSPKDHESYYDYKKERAARRGKPKYTLLLLGLAMLVLSVIFLMMYYG